jgi:hypothetical protein
VSNQSAAKVEGQLRPSGPAHKASLPREGSSTAVTDRYVNLYTNRRSVPIGGLIRVAPMPRANG